MKQRLWISVSSSLLAGSVIGTLEAVVLLLGVGAGEYDALFWGAFGYGLVAYLRNQGKLCRETKILQATFRRRRG